MSDEATADEPTTESPSTPGFNDLVMPDGSFAEGWQEHLPEDYKAAAGTAAKYKSLPELAKAVYHGQQRLSERDDRVTVPNGSAAPEEIAKYREALGIPAKADEYQLERPESIPEEYWDEEAAKAFAPIFHENNVPPAAAKAIVEKYLEQELGRAQEQQLAAEKQREENLNVLRSKFGPDLTKQLDLARRMAITAGVDPNSDGFNDPKVVEALAYAGRNMREDFMVKAEDSGGQNSSAALANRIMTDKSHPEYERFWADDPAIRQKVNDLLNQSKSRLI